MRQGLDDEVLRAFGIDDAPRARPRALGTTSWTGIDHYEGEVTIGVVGKYVGLPDAYKSLSEALVHGGIANRAKVNIHWLDAELFEHADADVAAELEPLHGILVPGGFGERGSEGKIASVKFAREREVPFFGICLGMQMACIEGGAEHRRDRRGLDHRVRRDRRAGRRPDHRMDERGRAAAARGRRRPRRHHAARRLSGQARRQQRRRARSTAATEISERHRHRYEVNVHYRDALEEGGLVFSGMSPDGQLPEIVERPDHPWFIGVQFHPELKSRPFEPHPLFAGFIEAAVKQSPAGLTRCIGNSAAVGPLRRRVPRHQQRKPLMLLTIAIILLDPVGARHSSRFHVAGGAASTSLLIIGIIVLDLELRRRSPDRLRRSNLSAVAGRASRP